jgi:hypothetical protein
MGGYLHSCEEERRMTIKAKDACEAGLAVSMSEARRMITIGNIKEICAKCGACRCEECQRQHPTCHNCGSDQLKLHKKGS